MTASERVLEVFKTYRDQGVSPNVKAIANLAGCDISWARKVLRKARLCPAGHRRLLSGITQEQQEADLALLRRVKAEWGLS